MAWYLLYIAGGLIIGALLLVGAFRMLRGDWSAASAESSWEDSLYEDEAEDEQWSDESVGDVDDESEDEDETW